MLFVLFMVWQGSSFRATTLCCLILSFYADDTQISVPITPNDISSHVSNCLHKTKCWIFNNFLLSFRLLTLLCVIIPVTIITTPAWTTVSPPTCCAAIQFFSQSPVQVCARCASACRGQAPLFDAHSPPQLREEMCCSLISDTAASTNYLPPCPYKLQPRWAVATFWTATAHLVNTVPAAEK